MWRVTAKGRDTGNEYVYEVDADSTAHEGDVLMSAFHRHGEKFMNDEVSELLTPFVEVALIKEESK